MSKWMLRAMLMAAVMFGTACDDDSTTSTPADMGSMGGAGGEGGGAGGEGGGAGDAFQALVVTELAIDIPGPPVGIVLRNLLNANIRDEAVIILIRYSGDTIEAGAANYVAGADTPNDPSDDVFTWLTAGTCGDGEGGTVDCEVEVGRAAISDREGGFQTVDRTQLDVYSEDLQAIIKLRQVDIQATVAEDGTFEAALDGVILQSDAANTPFELIPGSGDYTTLERLLLDANVMPDQMVDDGNGEEPAFTLRGAIKTAGVTFSAQ